LEINYSYPRNNECINEKKKQVLNQLKLTSSNSPTKTGHLGSNLIAAGLRGTCLFSLLSLLFFFQGSSFTTRALFLLRVRWPTVKLGRRQKSLVRKYFGIILFDLYREMSGIRLCGHYVNPLQPKVFGVKFSLREKWKDFFTKTHNFKLFKMPKL